MFDSGKYESLSHSQLVATVRTLDQVAKLYGSYINDIEETLFDKNVTDQSVFDAILFKIKEKKSLSVCTIFTK